MTLEEIMLKIGELSGADRDILRRELQEMMSKPETQEVTPETAKQLHQEKAASGDERGVPVEDVIGSKPEKPA